MNDGRSLLRLIAGGAFALVMALNFQPALSQTADGAEQQKAAPKKTVQKDKKKATKPKAKATPKAKPRPKPRPKPKPKPKLKPKPEPAPLPQSEVPVPEPVVKTTVQKQLLTREQARSRHFEGVAAELAGDDHSALRAFQEAAESGYGPAQYRLGEIYDRGNSAVQRDYAVSLGWYQKAREQGMVIPRPHTYPGGR